MLDIERCVGDAPCNAPSPAATSALPIGAHIVAQLGQQLRELPVFTKTKVAVAEA